MENNLKTAVYNAKTDHIWEWKKNMQSPQQHRRLGVRGGRIRLIKGLALLLGILLAGVGVWALIPPSTRSIPGEYAIAEIQTITLGGFP